jgi:hypothetical protein
MSTSTSGRERKPRLVLFAEGTSGTSLDHLWHEQMRVLLDLPAFERVVGIGKNHLVAMSNANMRLKYKTSTVSVGLDEIIAAELKERPFDCAVVAWDLVPPWDSGSDASACRWEETLLLYEGLARSKHLPEPWRAAAEERFKELKSREVPRQSAIPKPALHTVLAVCMASEFEGVLLHESGVKAALGLKGKSVPGWPNTWSRMIDPRPSKTLAEAIEAARRMKPKPAVFRKIHLPMRMAKHEWGSFFLKSAKGDFLSYVLGFPLSRRLKELLGASAR